MITILEKMIALFSESELLLNEARKKAKIASDSQVENYQYCVSLCHCMSHLYLDLRDLMIDCENSESITDRAELLTLAKEKITEIRACSDKCFNSIDNPSDYLVNEYRSTIEAIKAIDDDCEFLNNCVSIDEVLNIHRHVVKMFHLKKCLSEAQTVYNSLLLNKM